MWFQIDDNLRRVLLQVSADRNNEVGPVSERSSKTNLDQDGINVHCWPQEIEHVSDTISDFS